MIVIEVYPTPILHLIQLSSSLHNQSSSEPKLETIVYHPTVSPPRPNTKISSSSSQNTHANAITPSNCFIPLYNCKAPEDISLEFLFFLDSGASTCVLILPTFTISADHFCKCSKSSNVKTEF